jgi:hypothetical protein
MRVIKEIVNTDYRTTIFNWNNKYIIKLETSSLEQTYKIDQYDLSSDDDAVEILDSEFVQQIMTRFQQMSVDMGQAIMRLQD